MKNTDESKIDVFISYSQKDYKDAIIINSGDIIHNAQKVFKENMYDEADFHLSPIGCYLIGANLVKVLTGEKLSKIYVPKGNDFNQEYCEKLINFVNNQKLFK